MDLKLSTASALAALTAFACGAAPEQFNIRSENTEITLSPELFWNLNGIAYRNKLIGRQDHGFYGTVIRYDVGWVGTGHLENGIGETELELAFTKDGKPFTPAGENIVCKSFTMTKRAKLHHAELTYTLKLENDTISESAQLRFLKDQPLKIVYNFMHPWHHTFENFRLISTDGKSEQGAMPVAQKGKMLIFPRPQTASFYSEKFKLALFSTVTAEKNSPLGDWLFWNRGEQDRKMYFRPLNNRNVSAGEVMRWSMVTTFMNTDAENWQKIDLNKVNCVK